ncbi:MAG: DUF4152 family protein [Candidatus Bathyarchaeia archaeon]
MAADSAAAILNDEFEPLCVVATSAVLVKPPYRQASIVLARPVFEDVNSQKLIIHEALLCQELLKTQRSDAVHIDMTLGGITLEQLTLTRLAAMPISSKAKDSIRQALPKLRKLAADIKREHGVEVLAIGKESIPIRIAELTAGAHAIVFAADKVMKESRELKLGLPIACEVKLFENGVLLRSLLPAEHDLSGIAKDEKGSLKMVQISEYANPRSRGFRALTIIPKI